MHMDEFNFIVTQLKHLKMNLDEEVLYVLLSTYEIFDFKCKINLGGASGNDW